MNKTPDEIKKGLAYCKPVWKGNHWKTCDRDCPYTPEGDFCRTVLNADTLALIRQQEARIAELETERHQLLTKCERLEAERDAAVADIQRCCYTCKKFGRSEYLNTECNECAGWRNWQWRGVQKEE